MPERKRTEIDDEDRAKMYPGFKIQCVAAYYLDGEIEDICGSTNVIIENDIGWSDISGMWGDITLVCLDCGNKTGLLDD